MKPAALLVLLSVTAVWADTDGPGRGVARISVLSGDVSVRRGDSGEWVAAAINAPLVVQDSLHTGDGASRAEVQFDWANMIRLASNAEVRLAELEQRRYQVQVARGTTTFRVLRDSEADVEISTPTVSVRPLRRGEYRVTVLEDGSSEITVRSGEAEVFTPRGSERLRSGRTMLARGTASDPEFQVVGAIPEDDWDSWNERRDRDLERSRSYQYVSRDIYGAEDLDGHGNWIDVAPYGYVWSPRVAPGWAPYRYGRWSWIDWYGWTWVSYDPWGWAPYHYGRWFYHGSAWCWYPGPIHVRTFWRPALVAFFGFGRVGVGIGFGNVGWVPLAPYEPFYPWYGSRYYAGFRNRTFIDNRVTIVNNVNVRNIYRNSRIANGVTGVDASDFRRGRAGNFVRLSGDDFQRASLMRGQVPLTPERESLRLADRDVRTGGLSRSAGDRSFFSRRQPAQVDRVPFEEQRRGVEQIARRTWRGDEPGGALRGETPARAADNSGRGGFERSLTQRSDRTAGTGDVRSNEGWRRTAEPSRLDAAPARGGESAQRSEGRNWRRFGEPSRIDSQPRGGEQSSERRSTSGERRSTESRQSGATWQRFGSPARQLDPGGTSEDIRGGGRSEAGSQRQDTGGGRNFGDRGSIREGGSSAPVEPRRSERFEGSRRESFDSGRGTRSEPLRISPPIVREREAPRSDPGAGRMSGGSIRSGGDGGFRSGGGMRSTPSSGGMRSAPSGGGGSRISGGGSRGGGGGGARSGGGGGSRSGGGGRGR